MDTAAPDRLSTLPDEILISVLSLLSLREAARTTVLSSRWRGLSAHAGNLLLDANLLPRRLDQPLSRLFDLYKNPRDDIISEQTLHFLRAARRLLRQHRAARLGSLRLRFFLGREHARLIDALVDYALARHVEALELDLSIRRPWYPAEPYELPADLFDQRAASLKSLFLGFVTWTAPPELGALTRLELRRVRISEEQLKGVQSGCKRLERLVVANCEGLYYVKVFSPSLRYLGMEDWTSLGVVKLCAERLAVFEYQGRRVRLLFDEMRLLERVVLRPNYVHSVKYVLTRLPKEVPQPKALIILFYGYPREAMISHLSLPENPPIFTNLHRLAMSISSPRDLLWISLLLNASPFLHKFELHMICCHGFTHKIAEVTPAESHHFHLQEVEITGFTGNVHQIAFTRYILINAVNLELMVIDPRPRRYVANDEWEEAGGVFSAELESEWIKKRRAWVRGQLSGDLHYGMQLVIR